MFAVWSQMNLKKVAFIFIVTAIVPIMMVLLILPSRRWCI